MFPRCRSVVRSHHRANLSACVGVRRHCGGEGVVCGWCCCLLPLLLLLLLLLLNLFRTLRRQVVGVPSFGAVAKRDTRRFSQAHQVRVVVVVVVTTTNTTPSSMLAPPAAPPTAALVLSLSSLLPAPLLELLHTVGWHRPNKQAKTNGRTNGWTDGRMNDRPWIRHTHA